MKILKAKDLAGLTGLHPKHICRLARQDKIEGDRANPGGKQIWWIDNEKIRQWIDQHRLFSAWSPEEKRARITKLNEVAVFAENKMRLAMEHLLIHANSIVEIGMMLEQAKDAGTLKDVEPCLEMDRIEARACRSIACAYRFAELPITDFRAALKIYKRMQLAKRPS